MAALARRLVSATWVWLLAGWSLCAAAFALMALAGWPRAGFRLDAAVSAGGAWLCLVLLAGSLDELGEVIAGLPEDERPSHQGDLRLGWLPVAAVLAGVAFGWVVWK